MKNSKISNNIKFYIFLEVLRKYSHIDPYREDKSEHMILSKKEINQNIRAEIKETMDIELDEDQEIDRRTIYQYVDDLKALGFDISTYKENKVGYALKSKDLERYELKILVDFISANKFITKKKTKELIYKLCSFESQYIGYDLDKQAFISDRSKSINEEILYNISNIDKAINKGKKITFNYCDYNYNKELEYRTYEDTQEKRQYIATPVGLILKEDHYYLVTIHNKYNSFTNYRVDRMKNVVMLDEDGKPLKNIKGYEDGKFNPAKYSKQNFKMFAGNECEVALEINKGLLNLIIDELGEDVKLYKADKKDTFRVEFNANYGEGLSKWILQMGADAKVIKPDNLREDVKKKLDDMMKIYR